MSNKSDIVSFISGYLAGMTGVAVSYPFDTIKVRLQTQSHLVPIYQNSLDCFMKIVKTEGVRMLFRGCFLPLITIGFCDGICFGTYQNVKNWLANKRNVNVNSLPIYEIGFAGLIGGCAYTVPLCLFESARIKAQMDSESKQFSGSLHALRHMVGSGKFSVIFRGLFPTLMREAPACFLFFSIYESIVRLMAGSSGRRESVSPLAMGLAGGIAGSLSIVPSYPFDLIKTKMQSGKSKGSALDIIGRVMKRRGNFFEGIGPCMVRYFPYCIMQMIVFEFCQKHLVFTR